LPAWVKSLPNRTSLGLLLMVLIGGGFLPNAMAVSSLVVALKNQSTQASASLCADCFSYDSSVSPYLATESAGSSQVTLESLSDTGILSPRTVTQSATYDWHGSNLRTDTNPTPSVSLPVDTTHDWVGSQVNIAVSSLHRLFTLNGTFDTGINGTNVDGEGSAHPTGWNEAVSDNGWTSQVERTAYDNLTGTVMVENQGVYQISNGRYRHYSGTYARWNQTLHLSQLTSQFHLRFNYLYGNGPIGSSGGHVYLCVWFDSNVVWRQDLSYISVRDQWLDTGLLGINSTVSSTFDFRIGLYIQPWVDLDTQFLTLFLDNVSLTAATAPYPSEVRLQAGAVDASSLNVTDTGPGLGSAVIVHEYWETPTVMVTFAANCSIIFDCYMILSVRKTECSSWQIGSGAEGVAFAVTNGSSANLTLWTDVAYPGVYSDFQFTVTFPADWCNVTVFDSYPRDVTNQCTILDGSVVVAGTTAEQLGWWHMTFQSRNYAKSGAVQAFTTGSDSWCNETAFRCVDQIRVVGSIGTDSIVPSPLNGVAVFWQYPNGTLWAQEELDGASNGSFCGMSYWLGKGNTSAGVWPVQVLWQNGTEVAFRTIAFGLYHAASLSAVYAKESTAPGKTIMGAALYKDSDTGKSVLDPTAVVAANWSTTSVPLIPNPAQKQWEGDFDPDVVGLGVYVVRVNATHPFLDDAYCYFTIQVNYNTQLTSPNEPWDQTEWGTVKVIDLLYKFYNQSRDDWEGVDNATRETRVACSWRSGFWSLQASDAPGSYHIAVDTKAQPSGAWSLNITISRPGYESREVTITLLAFVVSLEARLAWLVPASLAVLLVVVLGLLVSRLVRKRRAAEQVTLLASRQEFEDARNIVTVIILNKSNGMPIYSSYSREGVRNELLAAFVSAISHFREEIVTNEREELFKIIPISDVVYMCATRTLLCALVTLMPPSERLKGKLVDFTKSLDRDFDDLLRQRDGLPVEGIIASTLHEVVQKAFDLRLLALHVADLSQPVPRRLRQVVRTAKANFPAAEIDLIQLSRYLQGQGQREKVAYNLILQAVHKGVLVALPPGLAPEEEFAASEQG
jgi:hypothetical protein